MYTSLDPAKSGYVLAVFCFTFFVMELNVQVCVLPPNLTESGQLFAYAHYLSTDIFTFCPSASTQGTDYETECVCVCMVGGRG